MAKRNQLEVGQQWAFSYKRNHDINRTWDFQMATIKAVEPYEKSYNGVRPTERGNGVLVEINEMVYGEARTRTGIIQLSNLFMTWEEFVPAKEEAEKKAKQEAEARKVREEEQRKFNAEVLAPALREFEDAIKATTGKFVSRYDSIKELPIEVLQAITNALKVNA